MDIPWNLCPFCGTPAPGMRRENITMDDALRPLPVEEEPEPETDEAPAAPAQTTETESQ